MGRYGGEMGRSAAVPGLLRVVSSSDASAEPFGAALRAARRAKTPLLMRSAARRLPCVAGAWGGGAEDTATALCERAADAPVRAFVSPTGELWLDGGNSPRAVLTSTMSSETTLRGFLDEPAQGLGRHWPRRYLVEPLDAPACSRLAADAKEAGFARLLSSAFGAPCRMHKFFVARGGTRTQLHRDGLDNIFVCAVGRRTFALGDEELPIEEEPGSISAAEAYQRPARVAAALRLEQVTLEAGDALYVPCGCWHEVEAHADQAAPYSCAVNWYFDAELETQVELVTEGET